MVVSSTIRTLAIAAAAVGVFTLAGCGKEEPRAVAPGVTAASNDVPEWVLDPTMGGKYPIAAYGVAEKMMAGEAMQKERALNDARTGIARAFNSKVQAIFKDWTREGGEITSQDNRQMAMTMTENISRNVTNQELQGTSARARFVDEKTGKLYFWMFVDHEAAEKIQKSLAAQARDQVEKRAHFASKIEADKAFADLDRLIDKELESAEAKK